MASGVTNETKVTFLGPAARAYFDELKQLEKEQLEELNRLKEQQWAKVQKKRDFVDSFSEELYNSLDSSKLQFKDEVTPVERPESAPIKHHVRSENECDQVKHLLYPERKDSNYRKKSDKKNSENEGCISEIKKCRYLNAARDDINARCVNSESDEATNRQLPKDNVKAAHIVVPSSETIPKEPVSQANTDHEPSCTNHSSPPNKTQDDESMHAGKGNFAGPSTVLSLPKLKSNVEEKLEKVQMDSRGEKENNTNKNNSAPPIKRPFLKKGTGLRRFMPKPISRSTIFDRKPKDQAKINSQASAVFQMTANSQKMPCEPIVLKHFEDDDGKKNTPANVYVLDKKFIPYIMPPEPPSNSASNTDEGTCIFNKDEKVNQVPTSGSGDVSFSSNSKAADIKIKTEKAIQASFPANTQDLLNTKATDIVNKEKSQNTIPTSVPTNSQDIMNAKTTAIINKEKNQRSNVGSLLTSGDNVNVHSVVKPNFSLPNSTIYRKNLQAIRENNQKEMKELIEYELLEDIVQTSINSDSSLIMDILGAEDKNEKCAKESLQRQGANSTKPVPLNSSDGDAACFIAYKNELEERRKALMKEMNQCDKKIKQFQTSDVAQFLANISSSDEELSPLRQNSSSQVAPTLNNDKAQISKDQSTKSTGGGNQVPKNQEASCCTGIAENEDILPVSSSVMLLREKLEELNKEIEIYKSQNSMIEKLRLLHENELKKLEKDKEDFKLFKANEIVKLENEIKEKKSQIMKEKQTFEKYQKLKRELPGKKEKEEYEALKKKYDSLQDEMKKKMVKSNAEIKRLRQLLDANEKELISLKAENRVHLERLNRRDIANAKETLNVKTFKKPSRRKEGMPKFSMVDSESKTSTESYQSDDGDILKSEFFPLKENVFETLTTSADVESIPKVDDIYQVQFNLDTDVKKLQHHSETDYKEIKSNNHIERIFNDGHKEILYFNGSRKYISANGKYTRTKYFNGDMEEVFPDKHSVYTFSTGYKQTFYPDGLKVYENPNKFVEKRFPDGIRQVIFKDNTVVIHRPDGSVERQNPNGGARVVYLDGTEILRYPSGEVEIRTNDYIRHEFTDGTVKTVYKNGKCETNYVNGRLRIKDKDGNVIFDNVMP